MSYSFNPYPTLLALTLLAAVELAGHSKLALAHTPDQHQAESTEQVATSTEATVPLFDDLGNYSHPISTSNPQVQRYFDQGLILAYGFNHAEALRAFQQAAELDPTCAICHWGMAYVLGPNINAAMEDGAVPTAWEAIQRAIALSEHATDQEGAYISALATRYAPEPVADRSELDLAYANAMRQVAQQYPDDLDAATLFAEALMDTVPWDYWQENGEPRPEGAEIITTLESVLSRNPYHVGAIHLYIHAVEAKRPDLAADAADRLRLLRINTGHLIHMPGHIYLRVGRYNDAVIANRQAAAADAEYARQHNPEGTYPIAYMPHNEHFGWYAATMSGQQQNALQAAHQTAALVNQSLIREAGFGTLQHYSTIPLYTYVKFGMWDEILAQPSPAEDLVYPTGVWHFARGMAYTAKGELKAATEELEAVRAIATSPALEGVTIWDINSTSHLLQIASEVLAGELAAKQGNFEEAIAHLQTGITLEDQLSYDEPSPWYSPVRQTLGAVLLQADRSAEAEQTYREDLAIYPENGWSLYGLAQSLQAQGKTAEAQITQERLEQAWGYADISLTASRLMD
ncbi:tetratricopeptide repeat protein [Oculatella sp. FACHB-28]|uniref:tetratricopeptide repeat protein n=1 Tax=Oculatella sp. FACHB-28 TaxID=2692845 RepID=UPI001689FB71|nr:tetratricopeptide repeat protein [Oculatella sp. FACHB-28]MBD2059378.1 tetratricopeptide repeat protein [Oculatella sp. FACHB-28]